MNILFYFSFLIIGFIAVSNELSRKHSSKIMFVFLEIMFLLLICSRIGHDQDYNDLNYYISYYENDDDKYFEPGYVLFVSVVKSIFGYNSYVYIICVGIFEVFFLFLSFMILNKKTTTQGPNNKDYEKYDKSDIDLFGILTLFYVYVLYWGCSFGCEVIRLGMAISILFCSVAFALIGKKFLSIVFFPFAFFFQYTSIILMIGIVAAMFADKIRKEIMGALLILSMIIDQIYAMGALSISLGEIVLGKILSYGEIFSHYDEYTGTVGTSFSPQYWAYHGIGVFLLFGNMANNCYKKSVLIYIIGLIVGTVFNGSAYSMRLQWLFLPSIIYALYYFAKDKIYTIKTKLSIIGAYSIIESIMAVRYLGYYL